MHPERYFHVEGKGYLYVGKNLTPKLNIKKALQFPMTFSEMTLPKAHCSCLTGTSIKKSPSPEVKGLK